MDCISIDKEELMEEKPFELIYHGIFVEFECCHACDDWLRKERPSIHLKSNILHFVSLDFAMAIAEWA